MKVGLCGTGKMGTAIAARLMDQGHDVTVWNRTADRMAPLIDNGAIAAESPAALAQVCETVIVMVYDDDAVDAVYSGEQGLLSVDLAGKPVILMCTTSPAMARQVAGGVSACGGAHVECPVGGTVPPALNGELLGLAGGEKEAGDRAAAHPAWRRRAVAFRGWGSPPCGTGW